MPDPCVLRSPDFYEKCHPEVTTYAKHIGELFIGNKQIKKS